jgi:hypothetical protein
MWGHHARGDVKLYARTQEAFPGFVLHRGVNSIVFLSVLFVCPYNKYVELAGPTIRVIIYAGDLEPLTQEFPLSELISDELIARRQREHSTP